MRFFSYIHSLGARLDIAEVFALGLTLELFTKNVINEEEYLEDIKDILGIIPKEYLPENIKKLGKKCWM